MSIIDNAKEIADLIKKIGDMELYRRIVDLEGEIIELTRTKRQTEAEVERLTKVLNKKEQIHFKKPFYYLPTDPTPYCPQCWEVSKIAVHLDGPIKVTSGPRYDCHNCKSYFINC